MLLLDAMPPRPCCLASCIRGDERGKAASFKPLPLVHDVQHVFHSAPCQYIYTLRRLLHAKVTVGKIVEVKCRCWK